MSKMSLGPHVSSISYLSSHLSLSSLPEGNGAASVAGARACCGGGDGEDGGRRSGAQRRLRRSGARGRSRRASTRWLAEWSGAAAAVDERAAGGAAASGERSGGNVERARGRRGGALRSGGGRGGAERSGQVVAGGVERSGGRRRGEEAGRIGGDEAGGRGGRIRLHRRERGKRRRPLSPAAGRRAAATSSPSPSRTLPLRAAGAVVSKPPVVCATVGVAGTVCTEEIAVADTRGASPLHALVPWLWMCRAELPAIDNTIEEGGGARRKPSRESQRAIC
ncbi:hypothetical protein DAI22_05g105400 [Oryza sativa Japonica Group]|nr:hypothetical protein DAI22_05g105400 [Oryza sativa Japonica Group]